MVLQIAVRDIGQLTDLCRTRRPGVSRDRGRPRGLPRSARREPLRRAGHDGAEDLVQLVDRAITGVGPLLDR
jgi:hypothetical protein